MTRRLLWTLAGIAAVLGAAANGACITGDVPDYPILIDPCDGGSCTPSTGVTDVVAASAASVTSSSSQSSSSVSGSSSSSSVSTSSSSSTGLGGSATTSDLAGTVHGVSAPTFAPDSSAYTGPLTIELFPASGSQQNLAYGGDGGAGFDAMSVAPGKAWLVALDGSNGAAGIWSTVSAVDVPQIAPIALPVIDAAMIKGIASTLPALATSGVSTTAAQIVVMITHVGQPLAGAQVSGALGGATIAYDTGSGTYSDSATATGTAGVILLFNSSLDGMTSISVTSAGQSTAVPVFTGAGIFTLASVDL